MASSDFIAFAIGTGANVLSQSSYAALPAIATGYQAGLAQSAQINKTLRQSSFATAAMAQLMCDTLGINIQDDGNQSEFETNLKATIQGVAVQATNAATPAAINIAGGTLTLTPAQAASPVVPLAGTLTSNQILIFPQAQNRWLVSNKTTGAFTVTCITAAAGAVGYMVRQGWVYDLFGDGTNILPAGEQVFKGTAAPPTATQLSETYQQYT